MPTCVEVGLKYMASRCWEDFEAYARTGPDFLEITVGGNIKIKSYCRGLALWPSG